MNSVSVLHQQHECSSLQAECQACSDTANDKWVVKLLWEWRRMNESEILFI